MDAKLILASFVLYISIDGRWGECQILAWVSLFMGALFGWAVFMPPER